MKNKTFLLSETKSRMTREHLFPGLLNITWIVMLLFAVSFWQCKKEDAPVVRPTVTSTIPVNNGTGIAINSKVTAVFSVEMDPSTVTSTKFKLLQGTTVIAGTIEYNGLTASFIPSADLMPNTLYTATITTGVMNMAGTGLLNNYTWSFTSVNISDMTIPTVISTEPSDNASAVPLNKLPSVIFSEAMDQATINSSTFTLMQGNTAITGAVTYVGDKATFTPAANLMSNTFYTGTITTGAKDITGNALAANIVWSFTTSGSASSLGVVDLGAAANYVVLAKTGISNISTSAITGDLGLSPAATSYITGLSLTDATGYATSAQVTGQLFAADMADPTPINLTTAVNNMVTAYNDAAGRTSPDYLELATGNIGGKTLTPGLYKWTNSVTIPSDVTISGNATDVWIFQIAQDLSMSNAVNLTLIGGAQAKNIFWQVAGTVTIGTTAHFEGIVLSMTGITLQTGASFKGRALAQTAVVLDGNTVVKPF
jgi:hypothetical protein